MSYTDKTLMPFGKYKGIPLEDVPDEYLLWCYNQEWCKGHLKKYLQENLEAIKSNIKLHESQLMKNIGVGNANDR